MIAVCIAIPLLLALTARWLRQYPFVPPVCAGLTLAACLSLPWTGADWGVGLVPDPLGIHLAVLASFAWLAASLLDRGSVVVLATMAFCLSLALLTGSPELTVLAGGAAALTAILAQPAGSALPMAVAGLGLALFGLALLHGATGAGLDWTTLAEAARTASGPALGAGVVLALLGLGCTCLLLPIRAAVFGAAMPKGVAILAGPLACVWLAVALRLRGVLDGNGHAIAPAVFLVTAGLVLMLLAVLCIRMGPDRLLPAALSAFVGAALFGFGLGGAAGTAAGLLELTLGCLALATAEAGGWVGTAGLAALIGVPPLGLFASAYGLFGSALARSLPLAVAFGVLDLALVTISLRHLVPQPGKVAPIGWVSLVVTLAASWALPPGAVAWLLGIAAAAR
jgi:hydrogenase-4 component F